MKGDRIKKEIRTKQTMNYKKKQENITKRRITRKQENSTNTHTHTHTHKQERKTNNNNKECNTNKSGETKHIKTQQTGHASKRNIKTIINRRNAIKPNKQ